MGFQLHRANFYDGLLTELEKKMIFTRKSIARAKTPEKVAYFTRMLERQEKERQELTEKWQAALDDPLAYELYGLKFK